MTHPEFNNQAYSEILAQIDTQADVAIDHISVEGAKYAQQCMDAWQTLSRQLEFKNGAWRGPEDVYLSYHKQVSLNENLLYRETGKLTHFMENAMGIKHDWFDITAFLYHDIHHLNPIKLHDFLFTTNSAFRSAGETFIFNEDLQKFSQIVNRSGQLIKRVSEPVKFVKSISALEQNRSIPHTQFQIQDIFLDIASILTSRFAVDDYTVLINENPPPEKHSNFFVINAHDDLSMDINESMLFVTVYNLAKNAAKANSEANFNEGGHALKSKYYNDVSPIKNPRNIYLSAQKIDGFTQISVMDQGPGVSLDGSLARIHQELAYRLNHDGLEEVLQSEWFWNIKRALGEKQAQHLIAWPKNPYSLRKLTVGSIIDCQFVAGFSGLSWELQSFTSGMGLWGVRYVTERLGGSVVATNSFDGGAIFTINIPDTTE